MSIPSVDELARRVAVAEVMAPAYAAHDAVAAVLLPGSVARGLADGRSARAGVRRRDRARSAFGSTARA